MLGLTLLAPLSAIAQSTDPFRSTTPPHPAPRPPPEPDVTPPQPAPVPIPPAAVTPSPVGRGIFDGTYLGSVTAATVSEGGKHRQHQGCVSSGTIRAIVTANELTLQQAGVGNSGSASYHGHIETTGIVSATQTTLDGSVVTVTGSVIANQMTGQIARPNCIYSFSATRQ
ncbi:MAG TPA: hypothetical protein VGR70_12700 [Stellaceae bacterium]|nr:hypothetical protein [Stellaceae bacterium]